MDANDCVESTSKKFTENVHKEEGGGLTLFPPLLFFVSRSKMNKKKKIYLNLEKVWLTERNILLFPKLSCKPWVQTDAKTSKERPQIIKTLQI